MKKTPLSLLLAVVTLGFIGCAQAPEDQIQAAEAALATADSMEADLYAGELYVAALDSFEAAQAEIAVQESAGAFSRDYDRAETLLAFAQETAVAAQAQVEPGKEAMRAANETLLLEAEAVVAQLALLPAAQTDVTLVNTTPDAATPAATLEAAHAAQAAGRYAEAADLARQALTAAQAELGTAPTEETPRPTIAPRV